MSIVRSHPAKARTDESMHHDAMAKTVRVPDFLPSTSGLRFANRWPPEPDLVLRLRGRVIFGIGDAANGLCGGMAFVTADHHVARTAIWPDEAVPPPGDEHFGTIVRRQLDTFRWGQLPLKYYSMMAFRPSAATVLSRLLRRAPQATASIRTEWPKIRAGLDAGRLVNVGLVRTSGNDPRKLTLNHQVLAYGYSLDGSSLDIAIYDPNHPGDDAIALRVRLDPDGRVTELSQSTGEPLFAFFEYPYVPKPPTT